MSATTNLPSDTAQPLLILPLNRMARRIGMTQKGLRELADAGLVPHLKDGKTRYIFNVAATVEAIAKVAADEGKT